MSEKKPLDLEAIIAKENNGPDVRLVLFAALKELKEARARIRELGGMQSACLEFAKAWAKWHGHGGLMLDERLIDASHGIVEALGLKMVENESTGKQRLVKIRKPKEGDKQP